MTEYIEREALLERIDDIWDCADLVFEPNDHCCRADDCASCKWAETKNAIRKIIANFSAADVRPVVRGKWEQKEVFEAKGHVEELQSAFCPVCQRYHTTPYSYYFTQYNYCPNCGAEMREES